MICYEVAEWLNNADGNGATDEQFAEVFALFNLMASNRVVPQCYDTKEIIKQMDVEWLCARLKDILNEIKCNVEGK